MLQCTVLTYFMTVRVDVKAYVFFSESFAVLFLEGGGAQRVRVNLYGALLYCLQIAVKSGRVEDPLTGMDANIGDLILSLFFLRFVL